MSSDSVSMVSSSFDTNTTNNNMNDGIKVYQFENDRDDTILINFTTKLANDISVGSSSDGSCDGVNSKRGIISRVYNKAASRVKPRRLVRER